MHFMFDEEMHLVYPAFAFPFHFFYLVLSPFRNNYSLFLFHPIEAFHLFKIIIQLFHLISAFEMIQFPYTGHAHTIIGYRKPNKKKLIIHSH